MKINISVCIGVSNSKSSFAGHLMIPSCETMGNYWLNSGKVNYSSNYIFMC